MTSTSRISPVLTLAPTGRVAPVFLSSLLRARRHVGTAAAHPSLFALCRLSIMGEPYVPGSTDTFRERARGKTSSIQRMIIIYIQKHQSSTNSSFNRWWWKCLKKCSFNFAFRFYQKKEHKYIVYRMRISRGLWNFAEEKILQIGKSSGPILWRLSKSGWRRDWDLGSNSWNLDLNFNYSSWFPESSLSFLKKKRSHWTNYKARTV